MVRSPSRTASTKSSAKTRSAPASKFWPDGARLAISLSLMVESPAEPPQMFLAPDGKRYADLPAETGIQYGYREGIPRLLDLFDRCNVKCSSFISGNCVELIPEIGTEIAQRGHECAAHGKMARLANADVA